MWVCNLLFRLNKAQPKHVQIKRFLSHQQTAILALGDWGTMTAFNWNIPRPAPPFPLPRRASSPPSPLQCFALAPATRPWKLLIIDKKAGVACAWLSPQPEGSWRPLSPNVRWAAYPSGDPLTGTLKGTRLQRDGASPDGCLEDSIK